MIPQDVYVVLCAFIVDTDWDKALVMLSTPITQAVMSEKERVDVERFKVRLAWLRKHFVFTPEMLNHLREDAGQVINGE